jgi:hypothetical protein
VRWEPRVEVGQSRQLARCREEPVLEVLLSTPTALTVRCLGHHPQSHAPTYCDIVYSILSRPTIHRGLSGRIYLSEARSSHNQSGDMFSITIRSIYQLIITQVLSASTQSCSLLRGQSEEVVVCVRWSANQTCAASSCTIIADTTLPCCTRHQRDSTV